MSAVKTIHISSDIHVRVDDKKKEAILHVGGWEFFIYYDRARKISEESEEVAILRRVGEVANG